jgi:hypothetical protein
MKLGVSYPKCQSWERRWTVSSQSIVPIDKQVSDFRLDEHSTSAEYAPAFMSTDYVESWSLPRSQERHYPVQTSIAHSPPSISESFFSTGDIDSLSAAGEGAEHL